MGETTFKPVNTHSVAYTGTHGRTSIIGPGITKIRVWASTDCYIQIAATPTATAADIPITAKLSEYFDVTPGDRVSFVQQSSSGTGWITEMRK